MPLTQLPALGPVELGGKSLLDLELTHPTGGLFWPAVDTAWGAGKAVLAPENLTVIDDTSSSQGGDAFYARGDSGIIYWFGHITVVPRQGTRFAKGAAMTKVSADHRHPHVHVAMDFRPLLGFHLPWDAPGDPDDDRPYSIGGPTIRQQLVAQLVPCVTRACMWQWIRWYRGREEYEAFGAKNPSVRPNVPKRIPATWWARLVLNLGGL